MQVQKSRHQFDLQAYKRDFELNLYRFTSFEGESLAMPPGTLQAHCASGSFLFYLIFCIPSTDKA